MLDHLSHALFTLPLFASVRVREKPLRPLAVEDLVGVLEAALIAGRLSKQTVAVLEPEQIPLSEAAWRVGMVIGRKPIFIGMPMWFHFALARLLEATMKIPLVSVAQVRILSEGIVEPLPGCGTLPPDLLPSTFFPMSKSVKGFRHQAHLGART